MVDHADLHRTARTSKTCSLCWRTITPDERYRRGVTFDGGVSVWIECAHCDVFARWLNEQGAFVWCSEGYGPDTVAGWEPDSIAGLRTKVGWRRKWTRSDGTLYPVPSL